MASEVSGKEKVMAEVEGGALPLSFLDLLAVFAAFYVLARLYRKFFPAASPHPKTN